MDRMRCADSTYSGLHDLIGKACLMSWSFGGPSRLVPVIPYGAYEYDGVKLVVAMLSNDGQRVTGLSCIAPDNLIVLDQSSLRAKEVYHAIMTAATRPPKTQQGGEDEA